MANNDSSVRVAIGYAGEKGRILKTFSIPFGNLEISQSI